MGLLRRLNKVVEATVLTTLDAGKIFTSGKWMEICPTDMPEVLRRKYDRRRWIGSRCDAKPPNAT